MQPCWRHQQHLEELPGNQHVRYAAGSLLPLQMDIMFCLLCACMYAGAYLWHPLGDYADQVPAHAFNWPAAASSISELWGRRWHQFLRTYFQGLGYCAADKLVGKSASPGVRFNLHTIAAFAMSAIMHEYLTWAAFGTVTGCYMAFFWLHCAAVLLETWDPLIFGSSLRILHQPRHRSTDPSSHSAATPAAAMKPHVAVMPAWAMRVWMVVVMALLGRLFILPYRAADYFAELAFHLFGVPVTERGVHWAMQHVHAQLGFAGVVLDA